MMWFKKKAGVELKLSDAGNMVKRAIELAEQQLANKQ